MASAACQKDNDNARQRESFSSQGEAEKATNSRRVQVARSSLDEWLDRANSLLKECENNGS